MEGEERPQVGLAAVVEVAEVGTLTRDRGFAIEEVRVERGRLDEVFRSITTAGA